ncbi:MAG: hypothetical protein J0H91_22025 [Rhodospirillales bacterium]|nr:hypothetical protein [Rhodospirillales bacterium]
MARLCGDIDHASGCQARASLVQQQSAPSLGELGFLFVQAGQFTRQRVARLRTQRAAEIGERHCHIAPAEHVQHLHRRAA